MRQQSKEERKLSEEQKVDVRLLSDDYELLGGAKLMHTSKNWLYLTLSKGVRYAILRKHKSRKDFRESGLKVPFKIFDGGIM